MFLCALTIFAGAFLLFEVQPLIAKIILPWFGGSAAVWTTCLLFFQIVLLFGYSYAHTLIRFLKPRAQVLAHCAVLLASALALPIYPSAAWKPATPAEPILRILGLLAVTVGPPYFALSATAPLLQAWYARRFPGTLPYRLYALSNAGSMLALLSYPALVEPAFPAHGQATVWSFLYGAFIALCAAAALRLGAGAIEPLRLQSAARPPRRNLYALWLALPACASALLLAVTSHLTLNMAAIPLLWVLPLSVYLLSFILCFERSGWYRRALFVPLLGAALAVMAWATFSRDAGVMPIQLGIPLFLAGLFVCSMTLHGELARRKPDPRYLTHFYLTVAAGGAAGGLFVGLAAPLLFNAYYELPVCLIAAPALALACLRLDPDAEWQRNLLPSRLMLAALAALAAAGYLAYAWRDALLAPAHALFGRATEALDSWVLQRELLVGAALALLLLRRGWNFRWARRWKQWAAFLAELAALVLAGAVGFETRYINSGTRVMVRNFYGGLRVHDSVPETDWGATRSLTDGTINHGEQFLNPARRDSPTTYFGPNSGIGLAIRAKRKTGPIRVGIIGLGTGTITAYGRAGDDYHYYEINPLVLRLSQPQPATPRTEFTFLADCKARREVTLGDGRLSLERESPQHFDVLAVDAFSSESVPVHLLTREAFELYFRHLKPDGILAVNISNRFIDLEPVVDGESHALGKIDRLALNDEDDEQDIFPAAWMLVTAPAAGFDKLILDGSSTVQTRAIRLWTDDYSNLFQILR